MSSRHVNGYRAPLAAIAAVVVALAVLVVSGDGALSPPPLGSPDRWGAWLDQREPVAAAFALLRLVALAGAWYVAGVTCIGVVLRASHAARLVTVADRFTVPPVRRLLAGTVTAGLLGLGPFGAVAGAQPAPSPTPTSTTAASTTAASTTAASTAPTGLGPGPTVVLRPLPAATPTPPSSPPSAAAARPAPTTPAGPIAPQPARWTVQPGDCFWTIADDVLRRSWGRPPTDAEIVPYWRVLIDANRQALADTANADLIFPGQEFDVPPAPPAPLARTG